MKDEHAVRECLPSEVHVRQTGDVEKVLHKSEIERRAHQHLQDQEKVQKLDDSKKDQELDDLKKNQELNDLQENQELDKSGNDKEMGELETSSRLIKCVTDLMRQEGLHSIFLCMDSKKDYGSEKDYDSVRDCDLDDLMEELRRHSLSRGQMSCASKDVLFQLFLERKNELLEAQAILNVKEYGKRECQRTELPPTSEALLLFQDYLSSWPDFSAEMQRKLMDKGISSVACMKLRKTLTTAPWTFYACRFAEDVVRERLNAYWTLKMVEKKEETETGGEGLETVHGEVGNYNQQSFKVKGSYCAIIMATLKKPSLKESDLCFISNANIIKTTILEKLLDNILPSKCHNPDSKSYNDAQIRAVDRAGSAPVPAVGDQLSVDKGPQKATSDSVTKESPDLEDLWDKELSVAEDQVSDMKMPQADAQAVKVYSTVETAQKVPRQPDQVAYALITDQAADVTIDQMSSRKEAQAIVSPQAPQVLVTQAKAPQTHMCPQVSQTSTLSTTLGLTVQTVPLSVPPQSDVLALATASHVCSCEAPQVRALPVAQVCTFEAAPKSAPAAVQVGCTFEKDLVLVPQAPPDCALEVDQGTFLQTGQVPVFSSLVAGCKAGDGVTPICKTDIHSQAETSQFTDCTVVPTPDELSHLTASQFPQLAPPKIVVDDVVVQQKCKVDVQPSSHVSENQSRSEGVHIAQQEEAGNDSAAGVGSVAPDPSTAIPMVMVVSPLPSSAFARNMVGLPTCTACTDKMEEQHKNVPTKEDSEERKKKAMDRLRKEREERVKQNTAAVKKTSDACSSSSKASGGVGDSDVSTPTHQTSHAVTKGLVLLSNVPSIFQEGAYVPLPSQEAMAKTIGKGGNGVVAYIYHGGREFAVKETGLRQEELETWSAVNHRNVIDICAVVEGDWDLACPGARRCFQMMPRVTGDIKSLLEERERPTLCHYFFDFKEDSESAGLVLGNAKYILLGVLNGLKHLHSKNIMHRDIKLQNILVHRHCQCRDIFLCPHDGDSGYGVFISDFDSALQVERGREKLERTKLHGRPIKYSVHGTAGYRPPETSFSMMCNEVLPEWVSLKTDIWSFGTMLVKFFVGSRGPHSQREMATLLLADCLQAPTAAQRPIGVKTDRLQQALAVGPDEMKTLQKVALLEKYFPLATDLHRLVQYCLTVNVEERPTVEQVMEKAFFRPLKQDSS